jgi:hypothetical protein
MRPASECHPVADVEEPDEQVEASPGAVLEFSASL